jgi:hypothetical protein
METSEILSLYDRLMRVEVNYPDNTKELLPNGIVRFTKPAPGNNFILYSQLQPETADAVIDEQIAYLQGLNQPFEWKVFDHDQPPDLLQRLMMRGLEPEDPDAILALELADAPASLTAPVTADVRRLTTREQLVDVVTVLEQVWKREFDWIYDRLGQNLEIPGYISIYAAYDKGLPASVGWIYFHDNHVFTDLWGGSTLPGTRGHGIYTAVLAIRVQEAIQRGYQFVTIDASPMSRKIVETHGFRLLDYAHACVWEPKPAAG